MRARLVAAALLVFCSCKKSSLDADSVEMVELVRAPMALSVPKWRIVEDANRPRAMTGLGGAKLSAISGRTEDGRIVMAGYYCHEIRTTFMLLALDLTQEATNGFDAAVAQFGCPGAGPPANSRKSACEVGATEFCQTP